MNRRTLIALATQVAIMVLILVPPLLVKATGSVVYLETEKMDPRDLFRGDYVILGYKAAQNILPPELAQDAYKKGRPVYVTVTTDRPARFVAVDLHRPDPQPGQACIVGRSRGVMSGGSVDFPQIAQYFVPEGQGREIESQRGENLLARVAVTGRCNAVLLGLEPR
jgi:uncharacterized membrane-anchored protein